MSYLTFLLLFLGIPISLLIVAQPRPMAGIGAREAWRWIGTLCIIAFVYTTPWDNYLVYRQVWNYGPERVLGTLGYVPYEEYAFFLLQPILTGLWTCLLLGLYRGSSPTSQDDKGAEVKVASVVGWLTLTAAGVLMLFGQRSLYLGLILAWAGPILAGMAWISAAKFWRHRRVWTLGIAAPTLYLWVADRIAIAEGIWDISNVYSFDFDPFGLPIEEAVFFLLTNTLVVQGLLMFLPLDERVGRREAVLES